MSEEDKIELSESAAEVYERDLVPAMFAQWAPRLADAVEIKEADHVLDVGCGTGIFARESLKRVGPTGRVVGIDLNQSMLEVGKRVQPEIDWRLGDIMDLPFDESSFNVVGSQFVLMFLPDRITALKEMWRVLKPGGRLIISVWAGSSAYAKLRDLAKSLGIDDLAESLYPMFVLSNATEVMQIFEKAEISDANLQTQEGSVQFPSIEDFVKTEIQGWVIGDEMDKTILEKLLMEARNALIEYCDIQENMNFSTKAHLITAIK